jgi:Cdc6-like AAA superfamily ATPase
MTWFKGLFSKKHADEQTDTPFQDNAAVQDDGFNRFNRQAGAGPKHSLPTFQGTASDQLREGHRGPLDQVRFRLRDAFTPSRPITRPQMFAGRTHILRSLIRAIEEQHLHVVIYGERGIGKTSLLNILADLAQNAKYLVRYVSCSEGAQFENTFRAILRDIPLLYHRDYTPTSDEAEQGKTLEDLAGSETLTVARATDILARLSNTRVVIILDEFDRALNPAFRASIAELIKSLSDRSIRVQLVIGGVAASLTELIDRIPSIRRNIYGMQIPNMSNEEIANLIQNGQSVSGLEFGPDVVRFITSLSCGSPYLASLISQYAGIIAVDRESKLVTRADVVQAIRQSLDEIRSRLQPTLHYRIDQAYADGLGSMLGLLACTALNAGGTLQPSTVKELAATEGWQDGFLDNLDKKYNLVSKIPGDPTGSYQFSDEGSPTYLWLRYADHEICRKESGKNT